MPPKGGMAKKAVPSTLPQTMSNMQNTKSGLDPEAENRFEVELCWCIQQIENSLREDMQPKQAEASMRSLNILKSKNASLIRKRQVMRNTFGDYRQKMAEDEKKYGKSATTLKFASGKNKSQKSVFLKKANKGISNDDEKANEIKDKDDSDSCNDEKKVTSKRLIDVTEKRQPFKFNFSQPECN